jgi:endo-1,4-beta-D-glucanase Y
MNSYDMEFDEPSEPEIVPASGGRRAFLSGMLRGAALATVGSLGAGRLAAATGITGSLASVAIPPVGRLLTPTIDDLRDWAIFKTRFIAADGRIVDTGNHYVSHTEGQGLGMLLAASFGDRSTFDLVHGWTTANLRASNGLHAWRWIADQPDHVSDANNATDGDIAIAAALQHAARRWQSRDYAKAARQTASAILENCVTTVAGRLVLLPGQDGFSKRDHVIVNPSYYIFPLFADLAEACPSALWSRLAEDGADMIFQARFGRWRLPADWLQINRMDGAISLARSHPARFSYDAVRVPLFLEWAGLAPEVVESVSNFWISHCPTGPDWVDLRTDSPGGHLSLRGAQSIASFISSRSARIASRVVAPLALIEVGDSYYSAALSMLTRLASHSNSAGKSSRMAA